MNNSSRRKRIVKSLKSNYKTSSFKFSEFQEIDDLKNPEKWDYSFAKTFDIVKYGKRQRNLQTHMNGFKQNNKVNPYCRKCRKFKQEFLEQMNKSFGLHLENCCCKETNGFLKLTSLMKTQIEHKAEYEKLYHKPYSFDKSEVTKNNDIINNYNDSDFQFQQNYSSLLFKTGNPNTFRSLSETPNMPVVFSQINSPNPVQISSTHRNKNHSFSMPRDSNKRVIQRKFKSPADWKSNKTERLKNLYEIFLNHCHKVGGPDFDDELIKSHGADNKDVEKPELHETLFVNKRGEESYPAKLKFLDYNRRDLIKRFTIGHKAFDSATKFSIILTLYAKKNRAKNENYGKFAEIYGLNENENTDGKDRKEKLKVKQQVLEFN